MVTRRIFSLLVLASMLASLLMIGGVSPASAANGASPVASGSSSPAAVPISPVDQTKVPHYFGPWPNWALSPLTMADVSVTIGGDGTGATATATVGALGAITGVTITDPGSGYTTATVDLRVRQRHGCRRLMR